jgi:pantothenate kinase-related protein Tda10
MKTYVVDIDGTICNTERGNYFGSKPIQKRIDKLNKLFDDGDKIIYYTARGYKSGVNWREHTEKQLKEWGAKHTKLVMGKPYGDFYLDNDNLLLEDFFK